MLRSIGVIIVLVGGWALGTLIYNNGIRKLTWSDLFVWIICSVLIYVSLNFRIWTAFRPKRKFKSLYSGVYERWYKENK